VRIYTNSDAGRDVAHPIANPALARNIGEDIQPLLQSEIDATVAFTQDENFVACIDDIANCDTEAFIAQNAPVQAPLAQGFLNEHILRFVNGEEPPALEDTVRLAENIMGANLDPVTLEDSSIEAAQGLAQEVRPDRAITQEPQPALEIPSSSDPSFPFVKTAIELAPSGMEKFPVTEELASPSLYNVNLLNTEGIIYLKQYTTDASETGLVFRFQFAPQDISYQRTAQLQSDPTWGTNVQPKHFTMTSGKKINLGNIVLDGMTVGNTVTNSIKALEILMSINEKAPIAQVSPYCYKLIIGDRTLADPFSNRHIPFVITSLQVKEEAYSPQGEVLHAVVSLSLEEIPFYQVNDGRKLMMLFEGATSEDEDNCANLWEGSDQHAEFLTECESINEDFNELNELRQNMRDSGCEDIPRAEGISAYNSLWDDGGFFADARGPADDAQSAINNRPAYGELGDAFNLGLFQDRNTISDVNRLMGSCTQVTSTQTDVFHYDAAAEEAFERIRQGSFCSRADLYESNGLNLVNADMQMLNGNNQHILDEILNSRGPNSPPNVDERECLLAATHLHDQTNGNISQISDPQQRRFQELEFQQRARERLEFMNERYDALYSNAFPQMDDDACTANPNCELWRMYGQSMTQLASDTGNDSFLDDLRSVSNDDN